jgi:hypothetical protein
MAFQIGDIVTYHGVQFKDKVGSECEIISILPWGRYRIKFLIDDKIHPDCPSYYLLPIKHYKKKPVEIKRIRWYNKGKLNKENENKINEYFDENRKKFQIGDIVTYHGNDHYKRVGEECEVISQEEIEIYLIKFLSDGKEHRCCDDLLKLKERKIKPFRIRWYNKGKLEESANFPNVIDLDYYIWNYINEDDGEVNETGAEDEIKKLLKGKNIFFIDIYGTKRTGIFKNLAIDSGGNTEPEDMIIYIKLIDEPAFLLPNPHNIIINDDEKKEEPVRVRWYNKGKLSENKLFESNKYKEGDLVIYNGIWFPDRVGDKCVIISNKDIKTYWIRFLKDDQTQLCREDLLLPNEEKKPARIRWYNKGKLHESFQKDDKVIYIGLGLPKRYHHAAKVLRSHGQSVFIKFKDGLIHVADKDKVIPYIKTIRKFTKEDPYGEENWDVNEIRKNIQEDIIIKNINPRAFLIRLLLMPMGNKGNEVLVNYLKHHLLGKVTTFHAVHNDKAKFDLQGRTSDDNVGRAGHWWIDDIYLDDNKNVHMVGHGFRQKPDNQTDIILYLKDDIEYEDKRIITPEDPYGEEDWDMYESNNHDENKLTRRR